MPRTLRGDIATTMKAVNRSPCEAIFASRSNRLHGSIGYQQVLHLKMPTARSHIYAVFGQVVSKRNLYRWRDGCLPPRTMYPAERRLSLVQLAVPLLPRRLPQFPNQKQLRRLVEPMISLEMASCSSNTYRVHPLPAFSLMQDISAFDATSIRTRRRLWPKLQELVASLLSSDSFSRDNNTATYTVPLADIERLPRLAFSLVSASPRALPPQRRDDSFAKTYPQSRPAESFLKVQTSSLHTIAKVWLLWSAIF